MQNAPENMAESTGRPESSGHPNEALRSFIGGKFVASQASDAFIPINPATIRPLGAIPIGHENDVDFAVKSARSAFESDWRDQGPATRKAILFAIADGLQSHSEGLARCDTEDMGKPLSDARMDVTLAVGMLRYIAETSDKIFGDVAPADRASITIATSEPRGVIAAIVPWNFPLINAVLKVAPALATGNAVVLKPSEIASRSALKLGEIATAAGLPPGVLNIVLGVGRVVGSALARHPEVDLISFTGSTAVGRGLMVQSGRSTAKPLLLELGGKSPQIVLADMTESIEAVADQIVRAAFWNAGQVCVARSRLLIERTIYNDVIAAVAARAEALECVDPLSGSPGIGPVASAVQQARINDFIAQAQGDGARLVTQHRNVPESGFYVAPTVFADVDPHSALAQQEVFGPVLAAMAFDIDDDAVSLANASPYGLAATIWTEDRGRGLRLAQKIRAGKVVVRGLHANGNGAGFALGSEPWGHSGFGVEGGVNGLRSYTRTKITELML